MQWENGFARLQTYFDEHGDCCITHRYKTEDGYALGTWVARQRALYWGNKRLKGCLSASRVARLQALGFVWDALHRDVKWAEGCLCWVCAICENTALKSRPPRSGGLW